MMTKETAQEVVAALKEVAALEGRPVSFDGRFGRLTDRCDRSITYVVGGFDIPTVEALMRGLHYEIRESRRCVYYGADRNQDWTITLNGQSCTPWMNAYGVMYGPLDEEGAEVLIKRVRALVEQAKYWAEGGPCRQYCGRVMER